MAKLEVTKDFQTFVDGVYIENYQETTTCIKLHRVTKRDNVHFL